MLVIFIAMIVLASIGIVHSISLGDKVGIGFFSFLTLLCFIAILTMPINTASKKEVNCKVHHCRTVSVIEYNGDPIITDSSYYVGKRDTVIVKITKKQGIIPFKTKIEYEVLK